MLLQSHLRSVDNRAKSIEDAAFVAYQRDTENANQFVPVAPDEKFSKAPYILHLLPALPSAWQNGKVKGLKARGGFEVDIEWENGKLEQAKIYAVTGGNYRIYSGNKLSNVLSLKKGETLVWKND